MPLPSNNSGDRGRVDAGRVCATTSVCFWAMNLAVCTVCAAQLKTIPGKFNNPLLELQPEAELPLSITIPLPLIDRLTERTVTCIPVGPIESGSIQ